MQIDIRPFYQKMHSQFFLNDFIKILSNFLEFICLTEYLLIRLLLSQYQLLNILSILEIKTVGQRISINI